MWHYFILGNFISLLFIGLSKEQNDANWNKNLFEFIIRCTSNMQQLLILIRSKIVVLVIPIWYFSSRLCYSAMRFLTLWEVYKILWCKFKNIQKTISKSYIMSSRPVNFFNVKQYVDFKDCKTMDKAALISFLLIFEFSIC